MMNKTKLSDYFYSPIKDYIENKITAKECFEILSPYLPNRKPKVFDEIENTQEPLLRLCIDKYDKI